MRAAIAAAAVILAALYWARQSGSSSGSGETDNSAGVIDWVNQAQDYGYSYLDNTDDMTAQTNTTAFLRAIRYGEGTAGDLGYMTLVGGGTFGSYDDHPANLGWRGLPLSDSMCSAAGFGPGCVSTAAGAYQINRPTFSRLQAKLGTTGFGPDVQDRMALELISEKGALEDVKAGRVADAVGKVKKIWASLPGAGYAQRETTLAGFTLHFTDNGGIPA